MSTTIRGSYTNPDSSADSDPDFKIWIAISTGEYENKQRSRT